MALDQSALLEILEVLKVADVGDRVRTAAETTYPALVEAELTDTIGAALHERTQTRTNLRNGHRSRALSTPAGDLELRVPKLRTGSFFPSLLERRLGGPTGGPPVGTRVPVEKDTSGDTFVTIPPRGPSEVLILMNRPDPDEGAILAP